MIFYVVNSKRENTDTTGTEKQQRRHECQVTGDNAGSIVVMVCE